MSNRVFQAASLGVTGNGGGGRKATWLIVSQTTDRRAVGKPNLFFVFFLFQDVVI